MKRSSGCSVIKILIRYSPATVRVVLLARCFLTFSPLSGTCTYVRYVTEASLDEEDVDNEVQFSMLTSRRREISLSWKERETIFELSRPTQLILLILTSLVRSILNDLNLNLNKLNKAILVEFSFLSHHLNENLSLARFILSKF